MKGAVEDNHPGSASVDGLVQALAEVGYLADDELATSIFLALRLRRPLFLEGEAGVGKTEVAKALARHLDSPLVRLQCYEGLDAHSAIYEWDYPRQLLHIRMLEAGGKAASKARADSAQGTSAPVSGLPVEDPGEGSGMPAGSGLYGREFLLSRPLLRALELAAAGANPVLLVDELDRADPELEAFLLEILSDFQVTIPELGTVSAPTPPVVVITSNRTREVHDAIRRRCLYQWVDYPDADREYQIVRNKAPGAAEELSRRIVGFVQELRSEDLYKRPGVAETLDWALALAELDQTELRPEIVNRTLGALLKYQDDVERVRGERVAHLLVRSAG